MRVLISGGNGFIGSWTAKLASERNYDVTVISRSDNLSQKIEGVNYIIADLTSLSQLKSKLKNKKFDYAINFAGNIDHSNFFGKGLDVINSHLVGVFNLISVINNDSLKKFIQIGTSDEYKASEFALKEDSDIDFYTPYAYAKKSSLDFLKMLNKFNSFPYVFVRLFLTYGPFQNEHRFLPQLIRGCINNENIPLTDCTQTRDFCYVEDIAEGIINILDSNIHSDVINLASGKPVALREIVTFVKEYIGGGNPIFGAVKRRTNEPNILYGSIDKAKEVLNWKPKHSLYQGLEKTIVYYKSYHDKGK